MLLPLVLLGVFLLSLAVGSVSIPLGDIITVLLGGEASETRWTTIILQFRLPRAVTAMLAGGALGLSGLQMQTLFRNPLADPFVLGINSGASLGVAVVVLTMGAAGSTLLTGLSLVGDLSLALAAGVGAGLVMTLVLLVARRIHNTITLLILGLMIGYGVNAFVSLLLHFSIAEQVQAYVAWTFGSFSGVSWSQMQVFAPLIIGGLVIAHVLSKPLNALLLGETYAQSMGVPVQRVRIGIIVSTALLAGTVTAFCGPIGFLGIAVPHLCRSLFNTSDHRVLLPATTLLGAAVALSADLIAQMPGSQIVLPLNAIMALFGAPVVVSILLSRRNLRQAFAS